LGSQRGDFSRAEIERRGHPPLIARLGSGTRAHSGAWRELLRVGLQRWRQLGFRAGTLTGLGELRGKVAGPPRGWWLRRHPLRAEQGDVAIALGSHSALSALRGPVLDAMPTVARFEQELAGLSISERDELVTRADSLLAHRIDLLGSGPKDLGPEIDWQLDFKSGRRWPLDHISRVRTAYPDGSDIKVPWELSRCQHLPLLAAAHAVTGERRYLDEIGAQLDQWIASNPVEFGANWACTMDVAIRAANWIATLALCAEATQREPWVQRVVGSLLLHGRFIRTHLEWELQRGNHYLSDVVGLLAVAALFSGSQEGRDWATWAAGEVDAELQNQVRADGCDHEASIPYHRLVAELFVCGSQAANALVPGALSAASRERLDRMFGFVEAYTRPDGLAPQIGDADDGRFLPLGDYGRGDFRSHMHLFAQAGRAYRPARDHAEFPHGGYFVMRAGDLMAIVRCGDVGLYGAGCHAHNDQLAFELALGDQPMVIDPGSYVYTADPAARNLFRSTAFHSTLRIGGGEQNELLTARLFMLTDRSRSEVLKWRTDGDRAAFAGRHHGYEALHPAATHERRIEFSGSDRTLVIEDRVRSAGSHTLEWTFPLAPCDIEVREGAATARFHSGLLEVDAPGLEFFVEPSFFSPSYGIRVETPFLRARRQGQVGEDVTIFRLRASER
jgi:uncharacterized heparinase superfamily protein